MAAETGESDRSAAPDVERVAAELVALMPRDLVFVPRFLGESQERLHRYFRDFTLAEMAGCGLTLEEHPMLPAFLDQHAAALCEFVFTGVALPHQLPLAEMERLQDDHTGLLRVDLWDQLKCHIQAAEVKFRTDMPHLAAHIARLAPDRSDAGKDPER